MESSKIIFTPIKSKRSFEEVFEKIRQSILNGTLKSGDKLPSEAQLAHQFNVGRQTIREALRLLELSGFISIQRGANGGPTVENTVLTKISDLLVDAIQLRKITIGELTVARIEIEKVILNYALDHFDDSDIKNFQDNIFKARKKIESKIHPFDQNSQFHILIAKATKNHLFVIVLESMMAILTDIFGRLKPDLRMAKHTLWYHEKILNAIKTTNRSEAITLLEEHLHEVEQRLQTFANKRTRIR
ncbi:MAG: FadR family transcriptional regulator [Rubrivivax sp.]|nr:FadR family transcriptional regulator [Rubrivivax sp.]